MDLVEAVYRERDHWAFEVTVTIAAAGSRFNDWQLATGNWQLATMSDLKEKRVELILQQLDELPTLPGVALRVLELTANDQASLDEVVALISSDPSLTARILQLVHRADVGVAGEVSSVERAIVLLGFEAVRSAVLAISVFETFRES